MPSVHTLGSSTHFGAGPSEASLREARRRQEAALANLLEQRQKPKPNECKTDSQLIQSIVEKLDYDDVIALGTMALTAFFLASRAAKARLCEELGPVLQSSIHDILGFRNVGSAMSESDKSILVNMAEGTNQGNAPSKKARAILRKLSEACDNEFLSRRNRLRALAKSL